MKPEHCLCCHADGSIFTHDHCGDDKPEMDVKTEREKILECMELVCNLIKKDRFVDPWEGAKINAKLLKRLNHEDGKYLEFKQIMEGKYGAYPYRFN